MKVKREAGDPERRLKVAERNFKVDLAMIKVERDVFAKREQEARQQNETLENQLGATVSKLKEFEEKFQSEKSTWEASNSQLTNQLDKTNEELRQVKAQADNDLQSAERTIAEIKAEMEVRIARACVETKSKISSGFLYTLWKRHPELDFSFLGKNAVEEVQKFASLAAKKKTSEVSTSLAPSEVVPPTEGIADSHAEESTPPN